MTEDEWRDFIDTIKANDRAHAGYFAWPTDRTLEEYGVVQSFHESLSETGEAFFDSYRSRGKGNDPPDCEALDSSGRRVGIEVTELVDGPSIEAAKAGHATNWGPPFTKEYLVGQLQARISRKDKPDDVIGRPYSTYLLIIYCDEPRVLDFNLIQAIRSAVFPRPRLIDRAFLLLSYSPWDKRCPYIELRWVDV